MHKMNIFIYAKQSKKQKDSFVSTNIKQLNGVHPFFKYRVCSPYCLTEPRIFGNEQIPFRSPYLGTDLVTALAGLDVHDFPHCGWKVEQRRAETLLC